MKIAIIEHYNCLYSNLRRRNRNADWEWDVRHEYDYDFYSDLECLSQEQYKIIYNHLRSLVKSETEIVESDHSYDTTQLAYVVDRTQFLADKLCCQIFEPGTDLHKIYKHDIHISEYDPDRVEENEVFSEEFPFSYPGDKFSSNVKEVETLPIIKYQKLILENGFWKGKFNNISIQLNNSGKLYFKGPCYNSFEVSPLLADVIYSSYNNHRSRELDSYGTEINHDYAIVVKNNKYGIVDNDGNLIVKHQDYKISEIYGTFCIFEHNQMYSCVAFSGQILLPFTSNKFTIRQGRYAEVEYGNFKVLYDFQRASILLNAQYDSIEKFTDNCIFLNMPYNKTDVYNYNSLKLTPEPLEYVVDNNEGLITGKGTQGYMAIDYNGNIIFNDTENQYTFIQAIDGHIRLLKKKENNYSIHGLADIDGNILFHCYSDSAIKIFKSGNESYYIIRKYKKERIYTKQGKAISDEFDFIYKHDNGICVAFNGQYRTEKGRIKPIQGNFYAITVSEETLFDIYCKTLFSIECQFLFKFNQNLATFKKNHKFGKVDISGNVIIPPMYEGLGAFHQGLAAAKLNGKWGYIDINNNTIIDFNYDTANNFDENGVAYIEWDGESTKINKQGEYLEEWKKIPGYKDPYEYDDPIIDDDYIRDGLAEAFNGSPDNYWNID